MPPGKTVARLKEVDCERVRRRMWLSGLRRRTEEEGRRVGMEVEEFEELEEGRGEGILQV